MCSTASPPNSNISHMHAFNIFVCPYPYPQRGEIPQRRRRSYITVSYLNKTSKYSPRIPSDFHSMSKEYICMCMSINLHPGIAAVLISSLHSICAVHTSYESNCLVTKRYVCIGTSLTALLQQSRASGSRIIQ